MARYFNKFPTINYNMSLDLDSYSQYQQITNITVRIGVIQSVLDNTTLYYDYLLRDGDTPEYVAEKVYGDPEAHWLVLLTNKAIDPAYEWLLDDRSFTNYIVEKYGSIEWAQTNWHHWEKVISRTDSRSGETSVQRLWIDEEPIVISNGGFTDGTFFTDGTTFAGEEENITIGTDDIPYDSFDTLPESEVNVYNLPDGYACTEIITRERVSYYDYESQLNESRRAIKLIIPQYWGRIKEQFNLIMESSGGNTESRRGLRYFS